MCSSTGSQTPREMSEADEEEDPQTPVQSQNPRTPSPPLPEQFVHKEHYVRSARGRSGYKGIAEETDPSRQTRWRVKYAGRTIGRTRTKAEACELYAEAQRESGNSNTRGQKSAVDIINEFD